MSISSFDDLLQMARQQKEPQRLLFVFAGAELPQESTAAQRAQTTTPGRQLRPLSAIRLRILMAVLLVLVGAHHGLFLQQVALRTASIRFVRRLTRHEL